MTALLAPSPSAVSAPALRLADLLNDLDTIVELLRRELEHGPSLNAYLLAAGASQIGEDHLQSGHEMTLKAAAHLGASRNPVMMALS